MEQYCTFKVEIPCKIWFSLNDCLNPMQHIWNRIQLIRSQPSITHLCEMALQFPSMGAFSSKTPGNTVDTTLWFKWLQDDCKKITMKIMADLVQGTCLSKNQKPEIRGKKTLPQAPKSWLNYKSDQEKRNPLWRENVYF